MAEGRRESRPVIQVHSTDLRDYINEYDVFPILPTGAIMVGDRTGYELNRYIRTLIEDKRNFKVEIRRFD